ncbi:hypothetical protein [Desulfonatronum thiodismutans]|uniref:hypothetical protein n=1 Tax=Desulfonatronum thiodismutans TaxID=159290 RepID=UPI001267D7F7|nr:hypothetical protein [Desulfonatronum thiodismutans]
MQGIDGWNTLPAMNREPLYLLILLRFHPDFFPNAETASFQSGNEQFFLLAINSSNYDKAYINTLTNNCEE